MLARLQRVQLPRQLALAFVGWYIFSSAFSLLAKVALDDGMDMYFAPVATPLSLAVCCFTAGALLTGLVRFGIWWHLPAALSTVDPIQCLMSFSHTVGTLLTLSALASGSVGVTYAVKACEPLTTALLSYVALQATYSPTQVLALLPIAAGLVVAASPALGAWSASLLHHSPEAAAALTNSQDGPASGVLLAGAIPALLSNIAFSARATLSKLKQQQLAGHGAASPATPRRHGPQRHLLAQFGYTLSPNSRVVGAPLPTLMAPPPAAARPGSTAQQQGSLRAAAAAAAFGDDAMQRVATQDAWTPSGAPISTGVAPHPFGGSESESAAEDSGGEGGAGVAHARHANALLPGHTRATAPLHTTADTSPVVAGVAALAPVPGSVYELDNVDRLLLANIHALLFCLVLLAQDMPSLAALSSAAQGMGHMGAGVAHLGWAAVIGQPASEDGGADAGAGGWMQALGRQPAEVDPDVISAAEMHHANAAGAVLNAALCHSLFSLCSFLVLTHLSPAQHSIANVCKRLFMIAVAAVLLASAVTPAQVAGAGITTAGVVWFFVQSPPKRGEDSACAMLPPRLAACVARGSSACAWALQQWTTVLVLHAAVMLAVFLQHGAVL
mgnify:CR=1 FL=1